VPAYAHVTSPLRRYADLVNQRQLLAFSKQMPFPYGQAEIAEIALGINEVLEQKKQERSQSFKEALVAKTARALETTRFSHLANHEILKALELSGSGGVVPERLVQELAVRLTADEGADRLAFSVLTMALHQPLAPELASACAAWLAREPGKVVSFLTHAANTGALLNVQIKSRATCVIPPVFEAVARVSVRQRETERVGAEARQSAKKDAERTAVLRLIKTITGLPLTIPDDVASEQNTARPGNSGGAVAVAASRQAPDALESVNAAKNQLVELTQKLRWPAAVYVSTAVGEAHKVQFSCVVSVVGPDGQYTGSSSGASTKKAGEMAAAADLLQKLAGQLSPEKARSAQVLTHASNAISAINEWAQRNDKAAPEYTYWSSKPNIGPFVCTVKILGVAETGSGRGNNKKDAKMKAAENMCQKLL
jgi:ribonuclease R